MFWPIAAISGFDNFLAIRVLYNMPKPRGDVEISSSLRAFAKLSFVGCLLRQNKKDLFCQAVT